MFQSAIEANAAVVERSACNGAVERDLLKLGPWQMAQPTIPRAGPPGGSGSWALLSEDEQRAVEQQRDQQRLIDDQVQSRRTRLMVLTGVCILLPPFWPRFCLDLLSVVSGDSCTDWCRRWCAVDRRGCRHLWFAGGRNMWLLRLLGRCDAT